MREAGSSDPLSPPLIPEQPEAIKAGFRRDIPPQRSVGCPRILRVAISYSRIVTRYVGSGIKGVGPRGGLPYKSDGGARRTF